MIGGRLRRSLAGKLLVAQLLVIVAGSATLALVALAVAPGMFQGHVRHALGAVPVAVSDHVDQAFDDALLIALAIAIGAALVAAVAVSWFLSLRVVAPVRALAAAAQRIAGGAYGARVSAQGSDELAQLGSAFNEMAATLESNEERRRELLADLAHELRTPLATVEGYVEGLVDGVVPADQETWQVLQSESRRLRRLVDDLQTVSRAEARQLGLQIVAVEVGSLVDGAVQAAQPAYAAKRVRLVAHVDRHVAKIPADPDRIGEVLANLLENALRHTPSGGSVEVSASQRGSSVELAVTDSGEGIAPEHLDRVFERFYRADSARTHRDGGSGIGLTIARAIVEAHGGTIRAASEGSGRGARFSVMLPAGTAAAAGTRVSRTEIRDPLGSKR